MKKILVGLSGGVDSAVAAYLLKEQGYNVVAGFMKNYIDEDNLNCTTYQDAKEAIKVAEFLGIKIISFDLRQEYEDKIVKYIYDGYEKGITPNPDILCNSLIKFDVFLDKALELGFDGVAMGHYARILPPLIRRNKGEIKFLPYNPDLKEKARELRQNMTKAEKKLWFDVLKNMDKKILKQQPIDEYIVDFYIASAKLIIEVDGETHRSEKEIKYDKKRTKKLQSYGLKVLRFTNTEIYENLEGVFNKIKQNIDNFIPPTPLNEGGSVMEYKLLRGVDYNKDQSYFLSGLNQYQLSKAIFPIGGMKKNEVRDLAKKIGLPNADRKDSQGLCFIGKIPMRKFLKQRLPTKRGDIVLLDGTKVGEHDGAYFFTIGQSRGLDINKKAYVVKIDVKKNLVIVSYDKQEPDLNTKKIKLKKWHWIGKKYALPLKCNIKIRYRQNPPVKATLKLDSVPLGSGTSASSELLVVQCEEEQWGVAAGQSVVAYLGEECLGGGIIE